MTITLPTEGSTVNSPIKEVLDFAERMYTRGVYGLSAYRNVRTALSQIVEIRQADEPSEPTWLLDNIGELGKRWAIRFQAKPDTAKTYIGRAKALLEDFVAFQADPVNFKAKVSSGATAPAGDQPKKKTSKTEVAPVTKEEPAADPRAWSTTVPTEFGEFKVQVPCDENGRPKFSRQDVARLALHLLPLAADVSADDVRVFSFLNPMSH